MGKQLARLAFVLILVSLACSMPVGPLPQETNTPRAVSQLVVAPADATATATPFQPAGATATPQPVETLPPQPTSTVDAGDVVGIPTQPTPVRINQELPRGTVNVLVMGSDFRPSSGFRTDVMMLVSIHPEAGTVSVISFPRDLYVTIPGWMEQRLNTAFPHGGFGTMADTLEYNFGVRPTFYFLTNFQGFTSIIDTLGGINVNAGQYFSDKCDLPQGSNGYCEVYPGSNEMDGQTALWYVRSRYSSSDLDRTRRAQEVLYGIFSKLMTLNAMTRLPELYSSYRSAVETNMGVSDMLPLLPVASQVFGDSSRIRRYSVGIGMVTPYVTEGGAQVLLPNYPAIQQMIQEAVYTP